MVGLIVTLSFILFVSSDSSSYHLSKHGKVDLRHLNKVLKQGLDANHQIQHEIVQTLNHYIPYSGLSYCSDISVEAIDCGHCKNTNAKVFSFITHKNSGTHAVILVDEARKEIVVSFRGSDDFFKVVSLISNDLVPITINGECGLQVHKPVKKYLDYVIDDINSELLFLIKEHPDFNLVLTGHSLGGALATLAAPILYHKLHLTPDRLLMVSYGQPKAGNQEFVDYFESLGFPYLRVVNEDDLVPISPLNYKFSHIRNYIHIVDGFPIMCSKNEPNESRCTSNWLKIDDHSLVGNKIVGEEGC